jgi:hypothetical protein
MSKLSWFLLNVCLLIAAVLATGMVLRQQPGARWVTRGAARNAAPPSSTPPTTARTSKPGGSGAGASHSLTAAELDELWQKSLFCPARTEEINEDTGAPATAQPQAIEFELVGIGVIGDKSAAIILTQQARVASPVVRSAAARGTGSTRGSGKDKGGPTPAPEPTKHVYVAGQAIGDTGYTVKEIKPTEVVLTKGAEERILKVERGDNASEQRSKVAVDDETRRRAEIAAKEPPKPPPAATAPGLPPPPPPPPPVPGVAGAAAVGSTRTPVPVATGAATPAAPVAPSSTLSQEERIQRALEERRRILERRRELVPGTTPTPSTAPR